jgi:hypothetical protein
LEQLFRKFEGTMPSQGDNTNIIAYKSNTNDNEDEPKRREDRNDDNEGNNPNSTSAGGNNPNDDQPPNDNSNNEETDRDKLSTKDVSQNIKFLREELFNFIPSGSFKMLDLYTVKANITNLTTFLLIGPNSK